METTDLSIKETALQEQISEKRTQLSGLYLSLGQKYYEFHRNDAEPAMQSAVEAAGQRFCVKCGCPLSEEPEESTENTSFEPEVPAGPAVCPSCGEPVDDDMAFCISCGYRLKR